MIRGKGKYYCNNPRCENSRIAREQTVRGNCFQDSYFICSLCGNTNQLTNLKKFYDGKTGTSSTKVDTRRSLHNGKPKPDRVNVI